MKLTSELPGSTSNVVYQSYINFTVRQDIAGVNILFKHTYGVVQVKFQAFLTDENDYYDVTGENGVS